MTDELTRWKRLYDLELERARKAEGETFQLQGQLRVAEALLGEIYRELSGNSNYVEKRMIETYFEKTGRPILEV